MLRMTSEREARGWSKNELARRARMIPSEIGKIEAGRLLPYPSQLKKIALAFKMPVAEATALIAEVSPHHQAPEVESTLIEETEISESDSRDTHG